MSVTAPPPPPVSAPEPPPAPEVDAPAPAPARPAVVAPAAEDRDGPPSTREVLTVCAAAFLGAGAAGWIAAGTFEGVFARVVALLAALLGAGLVALSYRLRRPGLIQYLTVPLALVTGAALVLPDAQGGSANLPSLVASALFSGGIAEPPVAFDPGWRFVLAAVTVLLGGSAASLALGFRRPNVAVFLPVPVVFASALVQPAGAEVVSTVVAFVMVVAGIAVAYGVELARSGVSSGTFEMRRLARGLGVLVLLAGGLVSLANVASFLLPEPRAAEATPPQRPEPAPPMEDRELFTVAIGRVLPWRLGVIDVYEENAWKLPPYDVERFVELQGPAAVPDAPTAPADGDVSATFTLRDLPGRALPTLAGAHRVELPEGAIVDYDPRTQTMRLPRHTGPDFTYTVTAAPPPTTQQLADAPEAGRGLREFLQAPPAPPEVTALLSEVPGDSPYARLHVLRRALYEEVVAAGAGQPVDVPPHRVVEMLAGGEASPYEITAAEALLARWAGVPSRIGYGYFGGERADRRAPLSVRPEQGSTWLEGYFEGHGWVPLLGRPAQARSSLSDAQKREDPSVRPTDELAVITYVPVRLQTITLLFELVRHYTLQAIPVVLAVIMAIVFYPALLRLGRRARRTRWARRHGLPGRIAVTYANLRDAAWDFNVGHPTHTPLEFVNEVAYDAEHVELAWLVTRALWGDLARDLQHADVEAAEAMAASVHARLRAAQPLSSRLLAAASRASLREPYSRALPNMWLSWSLRRGLRRAGRSALLPLVAVLRLAGRGWRGVRRRLRIRPALSRAGLLVLAIALALSTACAPEQLDLTTTLNDSRLPQPAVPKRLDDLTFKREKSAEKAYREAGDDALVERGRVYSVNRDDVVEASLQVAQFKPGLFGRQDEVRDEITQSLGGGEFQPTRVRGEHVSMLETAEQRLYLWFSPDGTYYELFVARRAFEEAGEVFGALLAIQRGEAITSLDDSGDVGVADPRRGLVQ